MKKIGVWFMFLFCTNLSFGQEIDSNQIFPKLPQLALMIANNGSGINVRYVNKLISVEVSSYLLEENGEQVKNREFSFGLIYVNAKEDHDNHVHNFRIGYVDRKMVNALWSFDEQLIIAPVTARLNGLFLAYQYRFLAMAEKPYSMFREINLNPRILYLKEEGKANVTTVNFISNFLLCGVRLGAGGMEINPSVHFGLDSREINRFQMGMSYGIGLHLRGYDYQKYYASDIISLEYISGNQASRSVSSYRLTINIFGVIDFFKRRSLN
ncbi:MAG: hypothetical protein ACOYMB_01905 [Patescibacteria group bacterium]